MQSLQIAKDYKYDIYHILLNYHSNLMNLKKQITIVYFLLFFYSFIILLNINIG